MRCVSMCIQPNICPMIMQTWMLSYWQGSFCCLKLLLKTHPHHSYLHQTHLKKSNHISDHLDIDLVQTCPRNPSLEPPNATLEYICTLLYHFKTLSTASRWASLSLDLYLESLFSVLGRVEVILSAMSTFPCAFSKFSSWTHALDMLHCSVFIIHHHWILLKIIYI